VTREGRDGCVTEKPGFMYSALPTIRTPGLAVGHSAVRSILQGHDNGKKGTPYEQVVWRPADREGRLLTEERKRVLTRKKKRASSRRHSQWRLPNEINSAGISYASVRSLRVRAGHVA
jgi:hypothetical protein